MERPPLGLGSPGRVVWLGLGLGGIFGVRFAWLGARLGGVAGGFRLFRGLRRTVPIIGLPVVSVGSTSVEGQYIFSCILHVKFLY